MASHWIANQLHRVQHSMAPIEWPKAEVALDFNRTAAPEGGRRTPRAGRGQRRGCGGPGLRSPEAPGARARPQGCY